MLISEYGRWRIRLYYEQRMGRGRIWRWWNKPMIVSRYESAKEISSLRKSMNEKEEFRKIDFAFIVFYMFILGFGVGYLLCLTGK